MRATVYEMPLAEAKALMSRRVNKFGNEAVMVDGYHFDSQAEADRYGVLRAAQMAGAITDLELQPRYTLQEGFRDSRGKWIRPIAYQADFRYWEVRPGSLLRVAEDVKGVRVNRRTGQRTSTETAEFRLKVKLWQHIYGDYSELRIIGSDGSVRVVGAAQPREDGKE